MDINIVWIIAVLLLATGAVKGFRKGLVEGVVRITSYVIGIIVLKYIECPYGTHTSCGYQIVAQDHQTVT